jgi:hypothetical protein
MKGKGQGKATGSGHSGAGHGHGHGSGSGHVRHASPEAIAASAATGGDLMPVLVGKLYDLIHEVKLLHSTIAQLCGETEGGGKLYLRVKQLHPRTRKDREGAVAVTTAQCQGACDLPYCDKCGASHEGGDLFLGDHSTLAKCSH